MANFSDLRTEQICGRLSKLVRASLRSGAYTRELGLAVYCSNLLTS